MPLPHSLGWEWVGGEREGGEAGLPAEQEQRLGSQRGPREKEKGHRRGSKSAPAFLDLSVGIDILNQVNLIKESKWN